MDLKELSVNKKPEIAVLLTCHNRKEKTLRCLKYLFEQEGSITKFLFEVFLVDDASNDGTGEIVRSIFGRVNIIKGSGNLFWSRGMHLAWKIATQKKDYDFYLWLNDDTCIFPSAIEIMLESYFVSGENAVICGSTKSEKTNKITYGGRSKKGELIIPNGSLQPCVLLNGNFVLVSRKIFNKIGTIDAFFIHSIGDHDYGLRALRLGFEVLVAPSVIGYCEPHEKLPKWCLAEVPLKDRFRSLYSPLGGCHPYYFFVYERRHFGLLMAMKHFFTIHMRVIFPALWHSHHT